MPRTARLVIPNLPYHITHRGNNREQIFYYDTEYQTYLTSLKQHSRAHSLTLLDYCLMPNHIHLIAVPKTKDALAQSLKLVHSGYAQFFNRRHQRCGHLWGDRFFACPLDAAHLVVAMRYVERNPVRAGLVGLPWDYTWSSAAAHLGRGDFFGLLDLASWQKHWTPQFWRKYLLEGEDEKQIELLRHCTLSSNPFGSKDFIEQYKALKER